MKLRVGFALNILCHAAFIVIILVGIVFCADRWQLCPVYPENIGTNGSSIIRNISLPLESTVRITQEGDCLPRVVITGPSAATTISYIRPACVHYDKTFSTTNDPSDANTLIWGESIRLSAQALDIYWGNPEILVPTYAGDRNAFSFFRVSCRDDACNVLLMNSRDSQQSRAIARIKDHTLTVTSLDEQMRESSKPLAVFSDADADQITGIVHIENQFRLADGSNFLSTEKLVVLAYLRFWGQCTDDKALGKFHVRVGWSVSVIVFALLFFALFIAQSRYERFYFKYLVYTCDRTVNDGMANPILNNGTPMSDLSGIPVYQALPIPTQMNATAPPAPIYTSTVTPESVDVSTVETSHFTVTEKE